MGVKTLCYRRLQRCRVCKDQPKGEAMSAEKEKPYVLPENGAEQCELVEAAWASANSRFR